MRVMLVIGVLCGAVGLLSGCGGTSMPEEESSPLTTREDAINECNLGAPQGSSCPGGVCVYADYQYAPGCRPFCNVVDSPCPSGGRCCPGIMSPDGQLTRNYCMLAYLPCTNE